MATLKEQRTQTVMYWAGILLTSCWFGASGWFEITKNPIVWDKTIALGYPGYFITLLGIAKLTGVLVLLIPQKMAGLKEWVFAGLFFDIVFAFVSEYTMAGLAACLSPLVAFIMVFISYVLFRKRKMNIKYA